MSIVANKFNGVRCALCNTVYCAEMAKKHNNANIIAMGSRIVDYDLAIQIIDTFMTSNFEGGRHKRRIDKIE
jgi:ribose 5-phosphate isomerase B